MTPILKKRDLSSFSRTFYGGNESTRQRNQFKENRLWAIPAHVHMVKPGEMLVQGILSNTQVLLFILKMLGYSDVP